MPRLILFINFVNKRNVDIDECAENADLCDNGTCINKPNGGGYWCKCKPGFVANNDMTKCDGNSYLLISTENNNSRFSGIHVLHNQGLRNVPPDIRNNVFRCCSIR